MGEKENCWLNQGKFFLKTQILLQIGSKPQGSYFGPANGEFRRAKIRQKLNSPAWKIYSPADEILLLTYFHGVIQGDRISTFLNCLVGKFQKIACGAILFQHLEFSTLSCFCCLSDHLLNFSHCFFHLREP